MNSELTIDPEFRDLIPPLSPEEFDQLEKSVAARGLLSPILVWKEENILIDGHNRHKICTEFKKPILTKELSFSSRESAKRFIILNQLGRRNVDPDTASNLRGMLYNGSKAEQGGDHKSKDQNDTLINTAETIAKQTGVSAPTIKRDGKFAEALEKLGMTIADFKASGKSKKDITNEAFPPKPKKSISPSVNVEPLTEKESARLAELETIIENAISDAQDDDLEVIVVDGTKADQVIEKENPWVTSRQAIAELMKLDDKISSPLGDVLAYIEKRWSLTFNLKTKKP